MLHSIHLENFRKHADLTINFTAGINAIRAPNEAGKTTLLEAIAYALFGTKGLKESLDDVVTYGVAVAKLQVCLVWSHAGISYDITRSSKGAELIFPSACVTGQTEVTKFVERLLGTTADMASKLMLAKQKGLGGALAGGPTAAGKMIEDLAGIDLIDQLISLIGEKWVAGNTSAAESRVESARGRAEPVELQDMVPLELAARDTAGRLDQAKVDHQNLAAELDDLDVVAANAILADQKRLQAAIATRATQMSTLDAKLAVELPEAPKAGAISALRDKVTAQKSLAAASKLHNELKAANVTVAWDEDLASLHAEIAKALTKAEKASADYDQSAAALRAARTAIVKAASDRDLEIAKLSGKLVLDESCAFCGKDLKDIPEVALNNNPLYAQIQALKAQPEKDCKDEQTWSDLKQVEVKAAADYLSDLRALDQQNAKLAPLYARAEAYITLDTSTVPALWTWIGPTEAAQDFAAELATLEAQDRAAVAASAARAEQEKQAKSLAELQSADQTALGDLQIAEAKDTLEQADLLKPRILAAAQAVQLADLASRGAASALSLERALQVQAKAQAEQAKVEFAQAEAALTDMQENNALIKKLRAARPQITDKLWSIVLAAVTSYFSEVRGFHSAVTRAENGFRVNGNPVTGLSGSAEDVLGLAIRIALTKTFLPNIDFLNLDEVAAACDDQREVAMLGLLATAGFAQVILVTHSPLCESFADNIITI